MAITPIAWLSTVVSPAVPVALVTDDDLQIRHPRLVNDLWQGSISYDLQLQLAFVQVVADMKQRGYLQAQTPNSAANREWYKEAVIRKAFSIIFLDFITELNDRWDRLRAEYIAEYEAWINNASLEYDTNDDGTISDDEDLVESPVTLVR